MTPRPGPVASVNRRAPRIARAVSTLVAALLLALIGPGAVATAAAPAPPAAPGSVTVVPGDTELRVTWSAPAGGGAVTSFRVEVRQGFSNYGTVVARTVVAASTRSVSVPGLTNGTVHGVRVVAVNGVGERAAGSVYATPRSIPPGAFALTTLTAGVRSISVGWSEAAAGTYPVARYSIALYEGYQGLDGPPVHVAIRPAGQTRLVTFTDLPASTFYYVRVVASDTRVLTDLWPITAGHQSQAGRLHGYIWGLRPR